MAVNIDTVYQKVLAFANKEQRGYITPQEFNLFADQAQKEIFEQYFYDLSQFTKAAGNSSEYSDITGIINEKIAIFETTGFFMSHINTLPGDLYRLGTLYINNREIEEVQQDELIRMNNSALLKPRQGHRVFVRTGASDIIIYPQGTGGQRRITYTRLPITPKWGYFVVGVKALYDNDASKNFELHAAEESQLVYKILKYAGLAMQRPDIAKGGQGLESLQIQQEKQ